MDKTVRKYANFDDMKADEYRYWQSRPVHERVAAVSELTEIGYKLKGFKPDAFRLLRTLVLLEAIHTGMFQNVARFFNTQSKCRVRAGSTLTALLAGIRDAASG